METKICTKCKEEKKVEEFGNHKLTKDKLQCHCKLCINARTKLKHKEYPLYMKEYYLNNKETYLNNAKEKYLQNQEYYLNKQKDYNKLNKDNRKIYNYLNKDKIKEYTINYNNSDKRKKQLSEYIKNRYKNNPILKIRSNISTLIYTSFKKALNGKFKKTNKSEYILGCKIEYFLIYLESMFKPEMNWGNHGKIWEIDHIIPTSSAKNKEELLKINHYTNFQPLFKTTKIAESFGYKNEVGNRNKSNKI
jgi:hypothetical protein